MKNIKLQTLSIPILGLGTWQLTGDTCITAVKKAIELGYTHIDTADRYTNHKEIAKAIKSIPREKLFITTKFPTTEFAQPKDAIKRYLKELGIDYLDLILMHWPDSNQDMIAMLQKIQEAKDEGLIKNFGVSNCTIKHLQNFIDAGITPAVNQVEFHPYLVQEELLTFCQKNNIVLEAYCPLGRGKILNDPLLISLSEKYTKESSQIILRWLIQKDIVAIPKASSEEHLKSNFDVFDFELSDEDMKAIDALNKNHRFVNPGFAEF